MGFSEPFYAFWGICQEKVSWTNPCLHLGISIETCHLSTVELLLAAYDTKSQKQARLDPEWRCDWCVFHKAKKPIHWVSQETNSPASSGVFSLSVWLSEHSFSQYSNYRVEKEPSIKIQHQTINFVGQNSKESQMYLLMFIYPKIRV